MLNMLQNSKMLRTGMHDPSPPLLSRTTMHAYISFGYQLLELLLLCPQLLLEVEDDGLHRGLGIEGIR